MNWPKIWNKVEELSEGLKTYAGTAIYAIGQYNAGVVWHVGGIGIPAGEILQAVGAALGGIGLRSKSRSYQQARNEGMTVLQAAGSAATQGPLFEAMKAPFRGGAKVPPNNNQERE